MWKYKFTRFLGPITDTFVFESRKEKAPKEKTTIQITFSNKGEEKREFLIGYNGQPKFCTEKSKRTANFCLQDPSDKAFFDTVIQDIIPSPEVRMGMGKKNYVRLKEEMKSYSQTCGLTQKSAGFSKAQ